MSHVVEKRPVGARALAASFSLHAALVAVAAWRARTADPPRVELRAATVTEVAFEAPPPPPPPPPPPQEQAPAAAPVVRERNTAVAAARPAEAAAHVAPAAVAEPAGGTLDPPREPFPAPTPTPTSTPPLRATDLLRAGGTLVPSLASESYGAERSPEAVRQRVQAIAAAPTLGALAESQNRLPTGTVGHDRTVARRAQEFLDPQREVTGIGALLAEAPTRSLGQIQRTAPQGEMAAGAAMDAVHAQSYTSLQIPPGYAPCQDYRALILTAELTHGADGAVTAARVVRSSGSRRLDEVALSALRDAHGEVETARGGVAPVSRWIVEVGEDRDAHAPLACGTTGGWTVWAPRGTRYGVRTRIRRDRTIPTAAPQRR